MENLICNSIRHQNVPEAYIFSEQQRPGSLVVQTCKAVPVIDIRGGNHDDIIDQILNACKEFGFFQVVNHGIPEEVINDMMKVAEEFFEMPVEDKAMYYSDDRTKLPRLFTSTSYPSEKTLLWRDCLRLYCYPLGEFMHVFPEKPTGFREILARYALEARGLVSIILRLISEGLGLEEDYFNGDLSEGPTVMNINHYPPCPEPELTLGVPKHCDPNLITLLLQGSIRGLQVLHEEEWIDVDPLPNSFIVNVGSMLEIITHGLLKSVAHRALTNSTSSRTTVAAFFAPTDNCVVTPVNLISAKNDNPPVLYRPFVYPEFLSVYLAKEVDTESTLDVFLIKN